MGVGAIAPVFVPPLSLPVWREPCVPPSRSLRQRAWRHRQHVRWPLCRRARVSSWLCQRHLHSLRQCHCVLPYWLGQSLGGAVGMVFHARDRERSNSSHWCAAVRAWLALPRWRSVQLQWGLIQRHCRPGCLRSMPRRCGGGGVHLGGPVLRE
jgi:hypothetical protein